MRARAELDGPAEHAILPRAEAGSELTPQSGATLPLRTTARAALLLGLAVGAVKAALTLPFIGRYGWHGDELYYLAAGKHPSLGYVDFPPLTAWVAWLVHALAGDSLVALRLVSLAITVAAIALVALMARELGGGPRAQLAAAGCFAATPYILAGASLYHTTWLDLLAWTAVLYVALRILARPEPRLWPLFGLLAGVGLEAKYTIAILLIVLLAGLVTTRQRRLLRTRGPWLAIAIAVLVLLPNLVWQARHGWPSWHFFGSQNEATRHDTPLASYLTDQLQFFGASVLLVAAGCISLWRRPRLRPLALAAPLVFSCYLLEGGRSYYPMPAYTLPLAAGAVAALAWVRRGSRLRMVLVATLVAFQATVLAVAVPKVVPVRSEAGLVRSPSSAIDIFAQEIGWPELARQTAAAWHEIPRRERPQWVLLASSYSVAGDLSRFGPALGLPQPLSGHLSWQYWRPARLPQRHALLVGWGYQGAGWLCDSYRPLAVFDNGVGLQNGIQGLPIVACDLRAPLGQLWNEGIATDDL
jgi:4-amino-4-deoxy-L-arabinose transferase-like glycosyltransferase